MRRHGAVERAVIERRVKQLRALHVDDRRPASAFRKTHALGCVHSCIYCRFDKIHRIPTPKDRRERARYRDSLAEVGLRF